MKRRPCVKVCYSTKTIAHAHRAAIARGNARRGINAPGTTLSVYHCPTCDAWHVGHTRDPLSPPPS
jgi:hypothetical protein